MKNLLLALFLLPFVSFAQTDLVKWVGQTNLTPTILNNNVTASNFTGNGINGPQASWDGIIGTNWPTANAIDLNKYFQVTVSPVLSGTFSLNSIVMTYKGDCNSYQVRYSKSADFSNPVTIYTNTTANPDHTPVSAPINGLNIAVNGYETLYIRFYAYNGGGNWKIHNNLDQGTQLTLRGTINSLPTPLNGTYVIGSAQGSNFPTITSAVDALNTLGVSGATTFLLDNTLYNRASNEVFPIVLNSYTGNATYPVTFKPNTGKNVTIESTNIWSDNTPAVFKLEGTDNVTFDGSNNGTSSQNLTIYNNNPLEYAEKSVIWLAAKGNDGASNNTIKNVTLKQNTRTGAISVGVFAASNGNNGSNALAPGNTANAANSENTVSNVVFTKVGQAVFVNGKSNSPSSGWKIQNCTIGGSSDSDKPFLGIYLNNVPNYEISGNSIVGILKNSTSYDPLHSGIIINGNSTGSIFNNTISDVYNTQLNNGFCAGIYINSSNNIVYNNMISNVRTTNGDEGNSNIAYRGHGVYFNGGSNNKMFFNTIYMTGSGSNNKRSSCVYIAGGSSYELKNNIFYNAQTEGSQYGIYLSVASSQLNSNYNDFVAKYAVYNNGTEQSLATWKSTSSKDANSIDVVPQFVSSTNLRIDNTVAHNLDNFDEKGTPVATYTTDIDGETRNASTPDIGADEFRRNTTTWNGSTWSHGTPNATVIAIINGAYNTMTNGSFSAKSLTVNSTGSMVVKSGTNLTIIEALINNAAPSAFVVESDANIIQSGSTNLNSGQIQINRNATMRRLDYVYWSSPVAAQNFLAFTPQTLTNRFYGHSESTNLFVAVNPATESFGLAKGYCLRSPNTFPANGNQAVFNGAFVGTPNNGNYEVQVTNSGSVLGYNLIGNPYPSTISSDAFLEENPTIETLYFWTHASQNAGGGANYASYNATGAAKSSLASSPNATPNGTIQTGQGFLVKASSNMTVRFTNAMRVINNDGQFFRSGNTVTKAGTTTTNSTSSKSRFWLNLSDANGIANQALTGYINNATNDFDTKFDAKLLETNGSRIYTMIGETECVIQGRAPFSVEDVVALGFKTETAGNFTISLDNFDGLFAEGQDIFLKDNLTGLFHNMKESAYTFSSETGTFNSRFVIVYQNSTLGIDQPIINDDSVVVFTQDGNIGINAGKLQIQSVELYDMRGRLVMQNTNINQTTANINPQTQKQVLLVKVSLQDNQVVTKKIVY